MPQYRRKYRAQGRSDAAEITLPGGAEGLVAIMQFIYLFLKYLLIYFLGCDGF